MCGGGKVCGVCVCGVVCVVWCVGCVCVCVCVCACVCVVCMGVRVIVTPYPTSEHGPWL